MHPRLERNPVPRLGERRRKSHLTDAGILMEGDVANLHRLFAGGWGFEAIGDLTTTIFSGHRQRLTFH
jgi:hypothetical protein